MSFDYRNTNPEGSRALERAEHYVWGDGADPVVGAAFAQMAQAYFMRDTAAAVWKLVELIFDEGRSVKVDTGLGQP